ncbi:MAG: FG-GAP-like repeat-containing protein [Pyrinomonadaceae bacterium]
MRHTTATSGRATSALFSRAAKRAKVIVFSAAALVCCWGLSLQPVAAQSFAPKVDYAVGSLPYSVAVGDFNDDGKPDIAIANRGSNTVSVLLNNGDGTFAAKVDYTTGTTPRSVAVGDFNVDGKPDLAVANDASNNVSVLLNNGAGTFAAKVDYTTSISPYSVAVGDFNSDGKPDLAVANGSGASVSVLLNNGTGTFAAKVDYTTGTNPRSVAVGDFNIDGKPDLLVANFTSNTVSEIINRASAPTSAATEISGRITTSDGAPLGGAIITLSGTESRLTITDSQGFYHFDNLETGGFYSVTPQLANYTFGPATRSFSLTSNLIDATFTAMPDAVQAQNPLDTSEYFVRQQYLDFLGREPDAGGFGYWSTQFGSCHGDASCLNQTRINVSAAYFIEAEFQQTGSFVYRLYKASFGARPSYAQFSADRSRVIGGESLETSKATLSDEFVTRAEFKAVYPDSLSHADFVNRLFDTAGISGNDSERQAAINMLNAGGTRSQVLRGMVESEAFRTREYNSAFVLMQYFGYLRRDPDEGGYQFWLNVLNTREPNNYRGMVCSFITSAEYQKRFSSVVTHSNSECAQ